MPNDVFFMTQAMQLAMRGSGFVRSNPLVGAVLVRDGRELARAFHGRFGGSHAEAACLDQVADATGATLYVNLEPCNHYGKTPPCCDRIIQQGVSRVVVANRDPNPLVNGGGLARLKAAGIDVTEGIMAKQGRWLNRRYFFFMETGRPYVCLKLAATLDGKIADKTGTSKWISSDRSRIKAHWLRGIHDALLVGAGTFLTDWPRLTTRFPYKSLPDALPVVLDRRLRLEKRLGELAGKRPYLIYTTQVPSCRVPENVRVLSTQKKPFLAAVLGDLAGRGVSSVLVEGGGEVAYSLLAGRWVNEVLFVYAPKIIGGREATAMVSGAGLPLSSALGVTDLRVYRFADDIAVLGMLEVC